MPAIIVADRSDDGGIGGATARIVVSRFTIYSRLKNIRGRALWVSRSRLVSENLQIPGGSTIMPLGAWDQA